MQYQVLARKWRPRNFTELVGQEHVSRTLVNALQSGRLAHAFLFSGPRGSGKTTSARILAKALNCHAGKPGEPCGACPSCTEIAASGSMDVLEIDAASNRGIDEIRELKEKARYNPARDKHKVFIIDEVHMLTSEAFNALLKTLEEPPPHVVFILATTEYHKIPATILSRCQQYTFKLIKYPLIQARLREISEAEGIKISNAALDQVVFSSGGSMRDAMSALDQVIAFSGGEVRDEDVSVLLGLVAPKLLSQTVHALAGSDLPELFRIVAELVEGGQDLNNFCRRLSAHFRNMMVLKTGIEEPSLLGIPESVLPDLRVQAELFSREDLLRLFDAFQKVEAGMKYANQVRFQLEMGLVELAHVARLRPLEELVAEFSQMAGGPVSERAPGTQTRAAQPSPSVHRTEPKPAATAPVQHAPAAEKNPGRAVPERTMKAEPPVERQAAAVASEAAASTEMDPKELLNRIAAAVGKPSLESTLQNLGGARLQGGRLSIHGVTNEFARRQVKDNLPLIVEAASKVIGAKVAIVLEEQASPPQPRKAAPASAPEPSTHDDGNLLEKVKREQPVVKSFLDIFPGPAEVEKIDS